jgi:threonine dehydrogenase-like Zn-dependent dehydrogenase
MQGIGKTGVVEKTVPRPGPNDAIVRTTAALICTSDSHTVLGAIGDRHESPTVNGTSARSRVRSSLRRRPGVAGANSPDA